MIDALTLYTVENGMLTWYALYCLSIPCMNNTCTQHCYLIIAILRRLQPQFGRKKMLRTSLYSGSS